MRAKSGDGRAGLSVHLGPGGFGEPRHGHVEAGDDDDLDDVSGRKVDLGGGHGRLAGANLPGDLDHQSQQGLLLGCEDGVVEAPGTTDWRSPPATFKTFV